MIHVGDIMSTVGYREYRAGCHILLFEYHGTKHPRSTHDIPHGTHITKDYILPQY